MDDNELKQLLMKARSEILNCDHCGWDAWNAVSEAIRELELREAEQIIAKYGERHAISTSNITSAPRGA